MRKIFFDKIPVKEVNNQTNQQFEKFIEHYVANSDNFELKSKIEAEINEAIYNLYSMDEDEMEIIECTIS